MIRFIIVILFAIFISLSAFSQEQFMGSNNGIYLGYGKAINTDENVRASNFMLHTEKGLLIGLGVNDGFLLSIGKIIEQPANMKFPIKPSFGVGYMKYDNVNIALIDLGFHKCFFSQ